MEFINGSIFDQSKPQDAGEGDSSSFAGSRRKANPAPPTAGKQKVEGRGFMLGPKGAGRQMHPSNHALTQPDKPAVIITGSGEVMTYGELEAASARGAHLFRSLGLRRGDNVAVMMKNQIEYFTVFWAAQRSGLYFVPVPSHLLQEEAAYIVKDCGAKLLILSSMVEAADAIVANRGSLIPGVEILSVGEPIAGVRAWSDCVAEQPDGPVAGQSAGAVMFYSSGTTGNPKGIRAVLPDGPYDAISRIETHIRNEFKGTEDSIYLSPAPLYHSAPTGVSTAFQRLGATVLVMERFDAEAMLAAIQNYRATHVQVVPTMFIRLLRLPEEVRSSYDLSSLVFAVHAAAPCPVEIKYRMLNWWGPIIYEYYAGSEVNGQTFISPDEWLRKPGSVGRPILGVLHICDKEGGELPVGEVGYIYFESPNDFAYHNDPEKTAMSRHPVHKNWSRIGDIGYVDDDGYLFLTDRDADMIISGGVNIYPQEIENLLILHPAVADVAVFGVPSEDMGEEVKAVVKPTNWDEAGAELATELIGFCRSQISHVKCPRSVDFERELPRQETGKLFKRKLKEKYRDAVEAGQSA
jgi:acyl-CoA synthetase (AMP-forming)/AMP-acid ligase II